MNARAAKPSWTICILLSVSEFFSFFSHFVSPCIATHCSDESNFSQLKQKPSHKNVPGDGYFFSLQLTEKCYTRQYDSSIWNTCQWYETANHTPPLSLCCYTSCSLSQRQTWANTSVSVANVTIIKEKFLISFSLLCIARERVIQFSHFAMTRKYSYTDGGGFWYLHIYRCFEQVYETESVWI